MDQHKRLLLAVLISITIITVWTAVFPPSREPVNNENSYKNGQSKPPVRSETEVKKTIEPVKNAQLGPFSFGIGGNNSGIVSLTVDSSTLLMNSSPGLLSVRIPEFNGEIQFDTFLEEGPLLRSISRPDSSGVQIRKELRLPKESTEFIVEIDVTVKNQSASSKEILLDLLAYKALGIAGASDKRYQKGSVVLGGKSVQIKPGAKKEPEIPGPAEWIVSEAKSHIVIFQPVWPEGMFHVEPLGPGETVGWIRTASRELLPQEEVSWKYRIYAGPIDLAKIHAAGMDQAMRSGSFSGITKLLVEFMDWAKNRLGNYGLAICLLSFVVWLPFSPLTWISMRSSSDMMEKMAKIKPQEARIRSEFAKNPQKMQQELMELYRRNKINPASGCLGCLPMLLTMPVYIALFQVLNRAPQLRGAEFLWMKDLAAPDAFIRFPSAIPLIGNSFNILPILSTIGMFFQQRLMKPPTEGLSAEQKAQQQIFQFMPLMLLFVFYQFPAGFMVYWVVNSLLMLMLQFLAKRKKAAVEN